MADTDLPPGVPPQGKERFWNSKLHSGGFQNPDGTGRIYDASVPPPAGHPDSVAWEKLGRNTVGGQMIMSDREATSTLEQAKKWRAANAALGPRDLKEAGNMKTWIPMPSTEEHGLVPDLRDQARATIGGMIYSPEQINAFQTLNGAGSALSYIRSTPRGGNKSEFEQYLKGVAPTGVTPDGVTDDRIDQIEQDALYAKAYNKAVREGTPIPQELPPPATQRLRPSGSGVGAGLVPGAKYLGTMDQYLSGKGPSSDIGTPGQAPQAPTAPTQPTTPAGPVPAQVAQAAPPVNALRQLLGGPNASA